MGDGEKPQLKPANENDWYCLATVYGEQVEGDFSPSLAKKNCLAWNRWMAVALSEEQRAELIKKGFDASGIAPFSDDDRTEFLNAFAERMVFANNTNATPPDPRKEVDFRNVRFKREVSFNSFVFPTQAFFFDAAFDSNIDFHKATFFSDVSFRHVAFSEADFTRAIFCRDADFSEAAFSSTADFREVAFFGDADFAGCEFKWHTTFAGAKFRLLVPDFRDAKLREVTLLQDVDWPSPPKDEKAALMQVHAYERLKAEMERLKKHEDEQKFFAKELRARRALLWFKWHDGGRADGERAKSAFGWQLNEAYDVFSGYGLSVGSPLFWLLVLFAIGADIFALASVHKGVPLPYDVAEGLSLTNLLPLLPYKVDKGIIDCLSPLAKIIGDLQSFLGVILLFLLGLALRNRFRMK